MTCDVFVPRPSNEGLQALLDMNLNMGDFTDLACPGVLITGVSDIDALSDALREAHGVELAWDPHVSSREDTVWRRVEKPGEGDAARALREARRILKMGAPSGSDDIGEGPSRESYGKQCREFDQLRRGVLSGGSPILDRFSEELRIILTHPLVDTVTLNRSPDRLVVTTKELCARDDRTNYVHALGEFAITLPLVPIERDDGSGGVEWKNLRGLTGGHHAPHISENSPCLGNVKNVLPRFLNEGNYAAALDIAIQFAQSANTSDGWGMKVSNWPRKT